MEQAVPFFVVNERILSIYALHAKAEAGCANSLPKRVVALVSNDLVKKPCPRLLLFAMARRLLIRGVSNGTLNAHDVRRFANLVVRVSIVTPS